MFYRVVLSGSRLLWLHTHGGRTCRRIGERIIDSSAGRIERNSALVDCTLRNINAPGKETRSFRFREIFKGTTRGWSGGLLASELRFFVTAQLILAY